MTLIERAEEGLKAPFDSTNATKSQAQNVAVVYAGLGFLLAKLIGG